MANRTILLHGWSDCSDSFKDIKAFLIQNGAGSVEEILYADYESREDHISYNDIIDGLNDKFMEKDIIDKAGKKLMDINVIVHSTGGLVIRRWISHYYQTNRLEDCPVKRIVMLAPANFGSPLAHRGKSFLGSFFKGRWKMGDMFEVGRQLLDGLELASPFQWWLAHQDLIIARPYYNAEQIQVTILVGIEDYKGLRGWVNKPGTDGTVVIAGTSLDSAKLVLDFSKEKDQELAADYQAKDWEQTKPPSEFGFGVLEGLDHGSIVGAIKPGGQPSQVADLLLKAFQATTPAKFRAFCTELGDITRMTYQAKNEPQYQQFIFHAVDDFAQPIRDFTMEFFVVSSEKEEDGLIPSRPSNTELRWSQKLNEELLKEVHPHTIDASYRRLLVDRKSVMKLLQAASADLGKPLVLTMRIYVPPVDKGIQYDIKILQNIVIYDPQNTSKGLKLFYDNTTTLVEMRVNRCCQYVRVEPTPSKH